MAKPSSLPSAKRVGELCYDAYRTKISPTCDASLRGDLEAFAEYFVALGQLESYFLDTLVPWSDFRNRAPNVGHGAVVDFLLTRAAAGVLTTNDDDLIESAGRSCGAVVNAALDGNEAEACSSRATGPSPLLKFHGCAVRDPKATVWTPSQLDKEPIAGRLARSKQWMTARLLQKDLLVLGFWTDWATSTISLMARLMPLRHALSSLWIPCPRRNWNRRRKISGRWRTVKEETSSTSKREPPVFSMSCVRHSRKDICDRC